MQLPLLLLLLKGVLLGCIAGSRAAAIYMNFTVNLSHPFKLPQWTMEIQVGTPPQPFFVSVDSGYPGLVLPTRTNFPKTVCRLDGMPDQRYDFNTSSTAAWFTCADAKRQGVTECDNCGNTNTSFSGKNPCRKGPSAFVADTVRLGNGVILPKYKFQVLDVAYPNFGFKVHAQDPHAPPLTQLMRDLKRKGLISALSYSACFNATMGQGIVKIGDAQGVVTSMCSTKEAMHRLKNFTTSVSLGGVPVNFKGNKAASLFNPPSTLAVKFDTGSLMTRFPPSMEESFRRLLERNCSSNPLVGVCNTSSHQPVDPQDSILNGTCYFLTEAQRRAFPDILIQIPAVNVSDPPYVLRYTSNDYLTNWRNYPCTWSLATEGQIYPMPRSCVGSDKFMVTWGFAASQHLGIPGHLIFGKDIYNRFMHSVDYENHILYVAPKFSSINSLRNNPNTKIILNNTEE